MKNYRAKRIRKWLYEYRGFQIECLGYYPPEGRVVWEAVDEYGCGFAHAFSLKECKMWINEELDKRLENNEEC